MKLFPFTLERAVGTENPIPTPLNNAKFANKLNINRQETCFINIGSPHGKTQNVYLTLYVRHRVED